MTIFELVKDVERFYMFEVDGSFYIIPNKDLLEVYTDFYEELTHKEFLKKWSKELLGFNYSDYFSWYHFSKSEYYDGILEFILCYRFYLFDEGVVNVLFYGNILSSTGDASILKSVPTEQSKILYKKLVNYDGPFDTLYSKLKSHIYRFKSNAAKMNLKGDAPCNLYQHSPYDKNLCEEGRKRYNYDDKYDRNVGRLPRNPSRRGMKYKKHTGFMRPTSEDRHTEGDSD